MSSNNFFREGCPAELTHGRYGDGDDAPFYIDTKLFFQSNGQMLRKEDAGQREPDAIRVVPVNDDEGSTYHDRVYAFTDDAATVTNQYPTQIPKGNVLVLDQNTLGSLAESCDSCLSQDECPFLKAALGRVLGIQE